MSARTIALEKTVLTITKEMLVRFQIGIITLHFIHTRPKNLLNTFYARQIAKKKNKL